MNKRRTLVVGVVFVLAFGLIGFSWGIAMAQEDAILIKIHSVEKDKLESISIDPGTVHIKKNTVVVWLSGVVDHEVSIEFADGKKCKDVTAWASKEFNMDKARQCYVVFDRKTACLEKSA